MYSGILQQEPTKILILLWDFASEPKRNVTCISGFILGAHRNTDFAMGIRYRNAKEMLYLLGGFYYRSPPKY